MAAATAHALLDTRSSDVALNVSSVRVGAGLSGWPLKPQLLAQSLAHAKQLEIVAEEGIKQRLP